MGRFDGAWRAVFGSELAGEGIVLLRNGTVLGCDHRYFYQGNYETASDGSITARIRVEHYAGEPLSIFGEFEDLTLVSYQTELRGVEVAGAVQLNGTVTGDPGRALVVTLIRLLPNPLAGATTRHDS